VTQANFTGAAPGPTEGLVVLHTSDLHLGGRWHRGDEFTTLRAVLAAAHDVAADVLILAGDIFDTHRAPEHVIETSARMLDDAGARVVILPGNHDPATPEAIYRRSSYADLPDVSILGVTAEDSIEFPALGLEIAGIPHRTYDDMRPLAPPRARTQRRRIVTAHGHWVRGPQDEHRAWLIHDHEIAASDADYVALGHWDVAQPVGDGSVPAFYSGSPELSKTVNIVRISATGSVDVSRYPLALDE
jgi:DNA repair exonuclease SbcCD nuclease subunit